MSFCAEKLSFKLAAFFIFACLISFSTDSEAQTRKNSDRQIDKKTSSNKAAAQTKLSKAELDRQAQIAEKLAAQQEAAEERRQGILQERQRGVQAAREAQARQANFERGLKNETLENIARDNTDGEDLEVRRAAVAALAGHAGTIVVLEPQTGKVLSIVNQDWAIRKGFKPCSTIKLVTATAGINEKVIGEDGSIETRRFPVGLNDALAYSNNYYFQTVGATGLGNTKMIIYARALGLGEPTGINAAGESAGRLPYGNGNARIYSHGDDFEVTPLQLAVLVSAISNGGRMLIPQIPRTDIEKTNFRVLFKREVNVAPDTFHEILPGMVGAVNYGTARRSGGAMVAAAGKTGSCIGQGSWLGLFTSVAPVANPKLAVVVVTRGSGERGKYAAAIAGKVYQSLSYRLKQDGGGREIIAKVPAELKPQPKVNAKTSALVDNAKGEDSDDNDAIPSAATSSAVRTNPKKGGDDVIINVGKSGAPVKSASKTSNNSSSPFAPVVIQVNRNLSRERVVPMKEK